MLQKSDGDQSVSSYHYGSRPNNFFPAGREAWNGEEVEQMQERKKEKVSERKNDGKTKEKGERERGMADKKDRK